VSFPATRLRRLRRTQALRDLVSETELSPKHLIQPLFVVAGEGVREDVRSMPGIERFSISELVAEATEIQSAGVRAVLLFGIPAVKDEIGTSAYDDEGVVQMAVRALKEAHPDLIVMTDEAHRSQYSQLAQNIQLALPNATRIGFTGTPIEKTDAGSSSS